VEIFISFRLLRFAYKSHMCTEIPKLLDSKNGANQRASTKCASDFIEEHSADIEYPFSTLVYFAHVDSSIFIHARVRNISVYFPRFHPSDIQRSGKPSSGISQWKSSCERTPQSRYMDNAQNCNDTGNTPETRLAEVAGVSPREIISGDHDF